MVWLFTFVAHGPKVPTDAVIGFCFVTTILATLTHLATEQTIWPGGTTQWLAILGLGLGPVGLAFYTWDHGVKHGNIQLLGAASYATPLLSTTHCWISPNSLSIHRSFCRYHPASHFDELDETRFQHPYSIRTIVQRA